MFFKPHNIWVLWTTNSTPNSSFSLFPDVYSTPRLLLQLFLVHIIVLAILPLICFYCWDGQNESYGTQSQPSHQELEWQLAFQIVSSWSRTHQGGNSGPCFYVLLGGGHMRKIVAWVIVKSCHTQDSNALAVQATWLRESLTEELFLLTWECFLLKGRWWGSILAMSGGNVNGGHVSVADWTSLNILPVSLPVLLDLQVSTLPMEGLSSWPNKQQTSKQMSKETITTVPWLLK